MMKLIDPILDAGFKLIFGREKVSEPLLVNLLNSIFSDDPVLGNIVGLHFINTEYPHEQIEGRGLRYDIRCVTSTGHHFIVEMQKGEQTHLLERSQYYVARALAAQGYKGKNEDNRNWTFSLTPVVSVFFCNFMVSGLEEDPVIYLGLCNLKSGKLVDESQRYVFIQLPCFRKPEGECESELDQWIYNIKNMGARQSVAFKNDNAVFNYLDSVSSVAALSLDEREKYEAALMYSRDYNAILATAKEKAMVEGLKEGIAKGREEGIAKGREEGALDVIRDVVGRLRANGMDNQSIANILGKDLEQIASI